MCNLCDCLCLICVSLQSDVFYHLRLMVVTPNCKFSEVSGMNFGHLFDIVKCDLCDPSSVIFVILQV